MKKNNTFFSRVYQFSLFLDVSFIHHLIIFGSVFRHSLSIYLLFIYLSVIYLFICYCCKKHSIATITQLRSLELLTAKTPLLHMLYYMNWLTHDFWTRTGGWEFDRSHGAGTSSPSHWQQVGEQAPKPVGCMMCFFLMTFVPVQKLCVNIYIYIYAFSIWVLLQDVYIHTTGVSFSIGEAAPHHIIYDCISGSAQFLGWMPLFVFFGLPIVSCSLMMIA